MSLLLFIILLFILYKVFIPNTPKETPLEKRNREWVQFILEYKKQARSKDQKEIINRMLKDLSMQGMTIPDETNEDTGTPEHPSQLDERPVVKEVAVAKTETKKKAEVQLDNASLLLYLGAFLFVASASLFAVFGGVTGEIRAMIVLLVSAIMYSGGIWLYKYKPKLKQAGLAFAGIGIAIAPIIGLAAYNYIFDQSNGSVVWLGTSILCLIMYTHALFTLRKPLINYIFILTFLSLFESGISMINAPIYYFGWMMAAIGIVLVLVSRLKGFWPELQESTRLTGAIFLPFSVLASLLMVSTQGTGQLGVCLLLAAAFYGLEALATSKETQQENALVAHISVLLGVSSIAYSIEASWPAVAMTVICAGILQALTILIWTSDSKLWENFATVTLIAAVLSIFIGFENTSVALVATLGVVFVGVIIWLSQKRIDSYVIASLAWIAAPVIFGQLVISPKLGYSTQALLLLTALSVQLLLMIQSKLKFTKTELPAAQIIYVINSIVVVTASYWASSWLALLISTLIASSMLLLAEKQKDHDWAVIAGMLIAAPALWTWPEPAVFLSVILISLTLNIFTTLRYRQEPSRWLSTILWLVVPIALGNFSLLTEWNSSIYAWSYLIIMVGLIISRAIARGVILASNKIPLASYARSASVSYVFGYCFAAGLALLLSLSEGFSAQSTVLFGIMTLVIWVISEYIEKQTELLVLIPLFSQVTALSFIYSLGTDNKLIAFTIGSTILAVVGYFALSSETQYKEKLAAVRQGSLIAVFITPVTVLFTDKVLWSMPIGLFIASLLVLYHIRSTTQQYRELAGGLATLSIFWMMAFWGVGNIQAYTHVLAALFAGYAYWRNSRGEVKESDNYLIAMLATATVPLALQAIGGTSGGLYGWWLILEQILFMIIGMSIGKRIITMWGLYVAVGAVLYQLRGLGWAALSFLAVFLIGLAIYKIQKYTDKE